MNKRINPIALKIFPYATIMEVAVIILYALMAVPVMIWASLRGSPEAEKMIEAGFDVVPVAARTAAHVLAVYCIYGLMGLSSRMEKVWYGYVGYILIRCMNRIVEGAAIFCLQPGPGMAAELLNLLNVVLNSTGFLMYAWAFYALLYIVADNLAVFGENEKADRCRKLAGVYLAVEAAVNVVNILFYFGCFLFGVPTGDMLVSGPGHVVVAVSAVGVGMLLILQIILFFMLLKACRMLYLALTVHVGGKGGTV